MWRCKDFDDFLPNDTHDRPMTWSLHWAAYCGITAMYFNNRRVVFHNVIVNARKSSSGMVYPSFSAIFSIWLFPCTVVIWLLPFWSFHLCSRQVARKRASIVQNVDNLNERSNWSCPPSNSLCKSPTQQLLLRLCWNHMLCMHFT